MPVSMKLASNKRLAYAEIERRRPARLLELGPCHGRDTVALSPLCSELITIEGRAENAENVRWDCRHLANVEVLEANLETFDLRELGAFDCVCAIGILYHLLRPWRLISSIQKVTRLCVGWTHLATHVNRLLDGRQVWNYEEHGDNLSGLSSVSSWLLPDDFAACWNGWRFEWLSDIEPHENGGVAAQFMAEAK